tara:strand:+ start:1344 stop:1865 length:522 start_codon:yes stop_codon:yes gene_type:complete
VVKICAEYDNSISGIKICAEYDNNISIIMDELIVAMTRRFEKWSTIMETANVYIDRFVGESCTVSNDVYNDFRLKLKDNVTSRIDPSLRENVDTNADVIFITIFAIVERALNAISIIWLLNTVYDGVDYNANSVIEPLRDGAEYDDIDKVADTTFSILKKLSNSSRREEVCSF